MGEIIRRRELIAGVIDMSKCTMADISAVTYTGSALTPTPEVTYNGQALVAGTDFTYSYANNTNAGTATCTATALSKKYKGSISKNFTINKASQSISLSASSLSITGASGTIGTFTVTSQSGPGSLSVASSATSKVTASISGTTVTCTSVASGSATITVTKAATDNYNAASRSCNVTATVWEWSDYKRVGGRIFYDNGDNGHSYKFYDSSYNELTTHTVSGLANAYYYKILGTTSTDRWYVYDNVSSWQSNTGWQTAYTTTGITADYIGSGKINTAAMLKRSDKGSAFTYIESCNSSSLNGCNDWFVASRAEQDKLRDSGLVSWFDSTSMWSSVEVDSENASYWYYSYGSWWNRKKAYGAVVVAYRAF